MSSGINMGIFFHLNFLRGIMLFVISKTICNITNSMIFFLTLSRDITHFVIQFLDKFFFSKHRIYDITKSILGYN